MQFAIIFLVLLCLPFAFLMGNTQEQKKVVILLGPPASGKGTQAIQVAKHLSLPHISTGDLFRENMSKNTELGQKAKNYIEAGKLVPDELVQDMLFDRLAKPDAQKGYILDGFPRTIPQAEAFEAKIGNNASIQVLNLVVSDDTIVKRALGRKRSDDTPDVIKERLRQYYSQTEPLIAYYNQKGVLDNIDGEKTPEQVFEALIKALN